MDALKNLFNRRSIRAYRPDPVDPEMVRTIIEAAMFAPSSGDQQPWRFVVIQSRETLDTIAREHPYAGFAAEVPVAILICGALKDLPYGAAWTDDCAAATQNMLLAAHAQGLGSVWLGLSPKPERMALLRRLAHLPEGIDPFAMVLIGHPAEKPEKPERFHAEWIRAEHWLDPWPHGPRVGCDKPVKKKV